MHVMNQVNQLNMDKTRGQWPYRLACSIGCVPIWIIDMYCSGHDGYLAQHTKFVQSRTVWSIPMYTYRQMMHFPVALNPKNLVGDMFIAVLMAPIPYTPSLCSLGPFGPSPCTLTGKCCTFQWP